MSDNTFECPECGTQLPVPADAEPGELLACPECAVEFELVTREPLHLELFEEDEK